MITDHAHTVTRLTGEPDDVVLARLAAVEAACRVCRPGPAVAHELAGDELHDAIFALVRPDYTWRTPVGLIARDAEKLAGRLAAAGLALVWRPDTEVLA